MGPSCRGPPTLGRTPCGASWQRARFLQRAVAAPLQERGASVWLMRNSVAGWNDPQAPSPVPDARQVLARLPELVGDVPVVLLGHSMGARTAVAVADDPRVLGVVGLAPWLPEHEPVRTLLDHASERTR